MKSIYQEFFYVPKFGRVREKVLLTRVAVTVTLMIFCLAAMSFAAYAYFSADVSSNYSIIKSANFNATVSVSDESNAPVSLTLAEKNKYKVSLNADTEYTVNLIPEGTAETGFCVVTVEGSDSVYYTQQFGKDSAAENGEIPVVTFKLKLSENAVVTIFAHWGTSSYYDAYSNQGENGEFYIIDGELIEINLSGTSEGSEKSKKADSEMATLPEDETDETDAESETDANADSESETGPKDDSATEPQANDTVTE